ncbi:Tetratricopeptide repeat protein 33 [Glycine max]|nr:Tetratricopeptide repeat protein 33 [Glycine max]KAH1213487.1 Tetratricopeptide repeat protein 33 [Glycine max]
MTFFQKVFLSSSGITKFSSGRRFFRKVSEKDGARVPDPDQSHATQLANEFQAQGDELALDGKYREALGKWEATLVLAPDVPVVHEQKAQVLLEIGDAWNALLKAATRATELDPSWAEAWVTLGRAQLNFGEPNNAIESFDRALALKEPAPLQFSLNESRKNGNKKEKRERWGETVKEKIVRGETSGESKIVGRKPDYEEAQDDRKIALRLVKKRKQLHSSGMCASQNRYGVGEKDESS